jgi:hypothetical protein
MTVNPVEVQRHLKGVMYPATRDELLEAAREEDAPPEVEEALEALPQEEQFDGPEEVMEAIEL